MGSKLHGIPVILYNKTKTGTDDFNRPIYKETPEVVENVLVGNPTAQEITDVLNLTGKKLVYIMGIPKGDTHVWTDRKVEFFNEAFHTVAPPATGIQDLIPLDWGQNVMVERYE